MDEETFKRLHVAKGSLSYDDAYTVINHADHFHKETIEMAVRAIREVETKNNPPI